MKPKLKEEFLTTHNALIEKYEAMNHDIKMFIKSSMQFLKEGCNGTLLSEEESVLKEYRSYVLVLFKMLETTAHYVGEMMSNMSIAGDLITNSSYSFSIDSDGSIADSLLTTYSDVTLIESKLSKCLSVKNGFNTLSENNNSLQTNDFFSMSSNNPFETNENTENFTFQRPKIPCGTMDTSIFKIGSVIPYASICSRDPNGSRFCIFINDGPGYELLNKLYNKKDCKTYDNYPEPDVVFGMKIDDGIIRAVRCLPLSTKKVYLPDFGEIVDMENSLSYIFHISEEEKNIPGQAIPCQLHNSYGSSTYQSDFLKAPLYEQMSFEVHNILNGVLYLSPQQKTNIEMKNSGNSNGNFSKLSPEEWGILNEEPLSTTSALKAVLGHVPKDDLRICPHYDPNADSCFKGSHCRREHVQMPTSYFTKDKEPANVFVEKPSMASIIHPENEVLEVLVTHVKNLEYFYGLIVDPLKPIQEPLLWESSDISKSDYLKVLPTNYDIVLAKFNDGNWYRAQVVDTYVTTKEALVFYMDYGNRQIVHLSRIAKCPQAIAELPARAQLFRMAGYHAINTQESEIIKRGVHKLSNMINDQYLKVCVVSHHEDLVVRMLEEPYCDLPKILADMHSAKMIEMY